MLTLANKQNIAEPRDFRGFHGSVYWQSAAYNKRLYRSLMDAVERLAISRFRWVGLPKTCDARYLEWVLLHQGIATISTPVNSKLEGWYSLQLVQQGPLNMYGNPSRWIAKGVNGTQFSASTNSGVYIFDNTLRRPIMPLLRLYVRELVDIYRTKQMNRMHQKIPYIITAPREQELTVANVLKMMLGGEPAIVGTEDLKAIAENVTAVNLEVPYLGNELAAEEQNVWNKIYSTLGISNLTFKAERQVQDEIRSYEEPSDIMSMSSLSCRREAAERLSVLSGYDVQVFWAQDFESDTFNFMHDLPEMEEVS